ncbi:glutathione peroxidase [Porphyromonas sp.]
MQQKIYDFIAQRPSGELVRLSQFAGKVLLIVNTASKCGFTPQFAGLEELYQRYRDCGLVILGFPCGQFLGQELRSGEDAASFCMLNYGVSFPMMKKVRVNGRYEDPIFTYLKHVAPGTLTSCIKWNFTKFLISRDGSRVLRFSPITKPEKLAPIIEQLLAETPIDLDED